MTSAEQLNHLARLAGEGFCLGFFIGILTLAVHLGRRGVESITKVPGLTP